MVLKSLRYKIPDAQPRFAGEHWFETFAGEFIVPLVETGKIQSFWFSRYIEPDHGKNVRFRIRTEHFEDLEPKIEELRQALDLTVIAGEENYDGSEIRDGVRFMGSNQRNPNQHSRYELVWAMLHATARLYLDCLSHREADGSWRLEDNLDTHHNVDRNTLETHHHLFCNLTGVEPRVDLLLIQNGGGNGTPKLMSDHYRKWSGIPDQAVPYSEKVKF